jgi:hypothetical protein
MKAIGLKNYPDVMRLLRGQHASCCYSWNSIPAKPLTLSCSNVAGFILRSSLPALLDENRQLVA